MSGIAPPPADPSVDPPICTDSPGSPLLREKLTSAAGVSNYTHPPSSGIYGAEFEAKVMELIERDLDQGNCVEALQLSAIFGQRSSDLELLLLAMDVAEGNFTVQSARQFLVDKFPESSDADFKDRQSVIDHVTSLMKHGRHVCQRISVYCGGKSLNFVNNFGT